MASSPRLRALFAISVEALRALRDGVITADDHAAIMAVIEARVAVAKQEAQG